MAGRIRLLNVITDLTNGGAERMLLRLSKELQPLGYDSEIVSMRMGGDLREKFEACGIKVHELQMQNAPASVGKIWRYREIEKEFKPDLVQGWLTHANFLLGLTSHSPRVPVVWNVRATLYDLHNLKPLSAAVLVMSSATARRSDAIIYNSALGRLQHEKYGYPSGRGHVIENGFDLHAFKRDDQLRRKTRHDLGIADHEFLVGMFARFDPQKGHEDFVKAAAQLSNHQKIRFVMAGAQISEDNQVLYDLSTKLGIAHRIKFLGQRSDVCALMNAVDLNVLPSRFGEGYPNVVGEAMACQTPCVVSDIAEQPEIVGEAGWVFPVGNVDELSKRIVGACELGPVGLEKMGIQARARISQRNSMEAITATYDRLYRDLLAKRRYEGRRIEKLSA